MHMRRRGWQSLKRRGVAFVYRCVFAASCILSFFLTSERTGFITLALYLTSMSPRLVALVLWAALAVIAPVSFVRLRCRRWRGCMNSGWASSCARVRGQARIRDEWRPVVHPWRQLRSRLILLTSQWWGFRSASLFFLRSLLLSFNLFPFSNLSLPRPPCRFFSSSPPIFGPGFLYVRLPRPLASFFEPEEVPALESQLPLSMRVQWHCSRRRCVSYPLSSFPSFFLLGTSTLQRSGF
ncbi:hypothetical protein C8R45DRAFT_965472, partial [Mycena sanguinolenta]